MVGQVTEVIEEAGSWFWESPSRGWILLPGGGCGMGRKDPWPGVLQQPGC